ncbi:hypothetical protein BHM03_00061927 [Ensete ventricosum]|nr:hypothetical protein BHM03_00061927 [Ensete ventricosum]
MAKHRGESSKIRQSGPLPQAAAGGLQVQTRSQAVGAAHEECDSEQDECEVLIGHTRIYKPKSATKQTKLGLLNLLQARYLLYKYAYGLLRSLVEHSCINPKSLAFGYLDEKPIDIGLMKFLGLCLFALSWYLEFAFAFSTSSASFRPMLSHYESKGSMTPQKSRLCV